MNRRKHKGWAICGLGFVLAFAFPGCGDDPQEVGNVQLAPVFPGSAAGQAATNEVVVEIGLGATSAGSVAFGANPLVIPARTTVIWENADTDDHTVTADGGAFDSGPIASEGVFSFTFNTPGTYSYHCSLHPTMTGTIQVTE